MNKIKVLTIFSIIFLLLVVGFYFYWNFQLSPVNPGNSQVTDFSVNKGDGVAVISMKLEEEKLIKSSQVFNLMAKFSVNSISIQAGNFQLSPSMGSWQIFQLLTVAVVDHEVTLIEGWRIEEMADTLQKELATGSDQFIKTAKEGYMFPDTYLFKPDSDVNTVVKTLEDNFDSKYSPDLQTKIKSLGLTPAEGVILASIVEREARSNEARVMVASILLKRYKIGMALQADATVQYALVPQGQINPPAGGWWKRHITAEDKKVDSPYNTYLYPGLPPKPICNPSLSALEAVASSTDTYYLYYYHDSKGVPHYATTLEGHNLNIANYL